MSAGWVPPGLASIPAEAAKPQAAALHINSSITDEGDQLHETIADYGEASAGPTETASNVPSKQGGVFGLHAYLSDSDSEGSQSGSESPADDSAGKDNATMGPFF